MNEHKRWQGLATKAIHAGFRPDPGTGAVNAPIYASSTFAQDGVGGLRGGFEYARTGNPTRAALEASLAAVEEAAFGRAFASVVECARVITCDTGAANDRNQEDERDGNFGHERSLSQNMSSELA